MPVKKTRKPAASVKYLLSGDRKLQRLSLKKISDRVKKTKPAARSSRVKPVADGKGVAPFRWAASGRVVVVGVVCLFAAAALLTARQPTAHSDSKTAGAWQDTSTSPLESRLTARTDATTSTPEAPARSVPAAPARLHAAPVSVERAPAVVRVKTAERAKPATSAAASPESAAPVTDAATLTIEGCLERDKQSYRLKNTSGLNAPKARSWRSGFLMKRSPSIELIDASGTLKLNAHVGQRVAATGTLVNRELHARTLRDVAASCQ